MPSSKANEFKNDYDLFKDHYTKMNQSITSVLDLTSRIDERVKMLIDRIEYLEQQFEKALDNHGEIKQKVAVMENSTHKQDIQKLKEQVDLLSLKMESISVQTINQESRWEKLFELSFKLIIMLIGGYLLFRFGWQAPP